MRIVIVVFVLLAGCGSHPPVEGLPTELGDTGLYGTGTTIDASNREYRPAWEAWSDGADKTRWIHLPAGTVIDTSDANAWIFPVGTKLWKEFRVGGARVETRMLWKDAPAHWTMATYLWSADQKRATLVSEPVQPIAGSTYEVPAGQCELCHQASAPADKPLGFSAAMLAGAGASGMTWSELVARGLVSAPAAASPPLASATPVEREAIGYLHANCGVACHRPGGSAPFSMRLDVGADGQAPAGASDASVWQAINQPSRFVPAGGSGLYYRLRPIDEARSTIAYRMSVRVPGEQMPPIGTHIVDDAGRAAISAWIAAMTDAPYPSPVP
jgi:hypothetical protein